MKLTRTPQDTLALLARVPLFAGVDQATLAQIGPFVTWREVKKGEAAVLKGSTGDQLMVLVGGRMQVLDITEGGREIGLNFLVAGDYFGELAVIDGLPRSASVIAMESSVVAFLPKAQALALFHQNALVAERVMKGLAKKLRTASVYQTILCLPSASQRVFALLQRLCVVSPGGLVVVENPPKQQELAIMANTSRETVSRALKVLLDQGIIEKDNHRLIVRRPAALQKLSSHDATQGHA